MPPPTGVRITIFAVYSPPERQRIFASSLTLIFLSHRLSQVLFVGQQESCEQGKYA